MRNSKILRKFGALGAILLMFVFGIAFYASQSNNEQRNNQFPINLQNSNVLYLSPILIDDSGVEGMTWEDAVKEPWCSGEGSLEEPYVIENVNIDPQGSGRGITIKNSLAYFIIENCYVFNTVQDISHIGILLDNVQNAKIINNTCSNAQFGITQFGIVVQNSNFINISYNYVENNVYGIVLIYSDENIISKNTALNNAYGIGLEDCHFNEILKNNASNNFDGIYLQNCHENELQGNILNENNKNGILLYLSHHNIITGNKVEENSQTGMLIREESSFNTVTGNFIAFNIEYGVKLPHKENGNLFYENVFIGNGINALDDVHPSEPDHTPYTNYWKYGMIGNYWDDYTGEDLDNNGIGDTPYLIPGRKGSLDNYPIMDYNPLMVEEIIEDVEELDITGGSEESLVFKLENALRLIESELTVAAIRQLNAFINQVKSMRGKKLTDEETDALISAAQWIIDNLVNNGS